MGKQKKLKKKLRVPIYGRPLEIIITKNVEKALNKIYKDNVGGDILGGVVEKSNGHIVIILEPKADINTICHESFHATVMILGDCGLELGDKSEEAYAYLIGWVAEKINKQLKVWNSKK